MSLHISSLNSGSNGNCYYVGSGADGILIDAGISRRETEKRLKRLGLTLEGVKAIFITHEHGDHIHGLRGITKRYNIPVYFSRMTLEKSGLELPEGIARTFQSNEEIKVGDLLVKAFLKRHDACDPHSFVVTCNGVTIGVFTDIGSPCDELKKHFSQCHAAFLESNYDEEMLDKGRYPYPLKTRIRGGFGHLSNRQALKFFLEHRPPHMSHLFLAHLSRENNSPQLATNLFAGKTGKTRVIVAGRDMETQLYAINDAGRNFTMKPLFTKTFLKRTQLSLFS
jgi:phosphoribosyl 1,2-cyclic phosphodiesterase